MRPRGIKDAAGNPYNPSYYKRGLHTAIERGGFAVADYIRRYLSKPPNEGYRKLRAPTSLDLACEALIADPDKPYARLFTHAKRRAARERLAHHLDAVDRRNEARARRIAALAQICVKQLMSSDGWPLSQPIPRIPGDQFSDLGLRTRRRCSAEPLWPSLRRSRDGGASNELFRRVLHLQPNNPIATRR